MKMVRFAVVGFGNIARTHMMALQALKVWKTLPVVPILDTLVTRDPEGKRAQAEAIGFTHVTSSLEEALRERELDVVDICTPNSMHLEAVETAVRYGKTLYVEKPLTDKLEASEQLVKLATAGSIEGQGSSPMNKPHQVVLNFRYHPAVLRISEVLRQGTIGHVLHAKVSYRRSGYLNASRPVSWRLDEKESGGGAISDLGVHALDLLAHWFGPMADVKGRTNIFVKERPQADGQGIAQIGVDDWALMDIQHESGVQAQAEVSRIAWGSEAFQVDIVGTKGSIVCDLEKEIAPRVKLLDGSVPPAVQPNTLQLSTDEKNTMGMLVDSHFGALHHFLYRLSGDDRWEGLAPRLQDALVAERWIAQVRSQELRNGTKGSGA